MLNWTVATLNILDNKLNRLLICHNAWIKLVNSIARIHGKKTFWRSHKVHFIIEKPGLSCSNYAAEKMILICDR